MSTLTPIALYCEYQPEPLGLDVKQPRFSWILQATNPERRNLQQTAYHILVAASQQALAADRGDLWDSGRVDSSRSVHVVYSGGPLDSRQRCWWKVRVWDQDGNASDWSAPAVFEMGLLYPFDWQARWIEIPYPLPEEFPDHNGYHSALETSPEVAKWVMLDLGEPKRIDAVRLFPARPFDWPDTPGFLFPVRLRVEVALAPDAFRTVVDLTDADIPNPGTEPQRYTFGPVEARYVRLVITRLRHRDADHYGFALAELEALDGDAVVSRGAPVTAADSIETGAWSLKNLTDGVTVSRRGQGGEAMPASMLRTGFWLDEAPRRARAYVTALGLYELRINGQRVGDHVLAPEWTDYTKRVQYQTFDVTTLLRRGENAVGALCGDGWYAGRIGLLPRRHNYGQRPRFLLQLEMEGEGGEIWRIVSDGTWRGTIEGPVRSSDILDGEVYDARREMPGWDAPGFDDAGWEAVAVADDVNVALVSQYNEPIQVTQEMKPIALMEPSPGVFVFDLGQNMVGWCRLRAKGPAGTEIRLRHAEVLNPDGTIYTANLRSAPQTDVFFLRGEGEEVFEPHFTYHGFRYVEVTGYPGRPDLETLVGRVVRSAVPVVGSFTCSSPLLNRLMQNIRWTLWGNLHSTPTDCPQRDERLGWMGDAQIIAQTACFDLGMARFYTKWIQDIRDAQNAEGHYASFCPNPHNMFHNAPAWADAGIIVPWRVYENYGDTRVLEQHFDSARRFIESIRTANPDLIWRKARGPDFGDWLNADTLILEDWPRQGGATPIDLLATAFFQHSTQLLTKMAEALGREPEAQEYAALAEQIRAAFQHAFVGKDGSVASETQTAYALALHFGLLPAEFQPLAVRRIVESIRERYNGHLSTGIQGTHRMILELADRGELDVAYQLLNNRSIPSWGYMVDHGATTVWERWDGWVEGRGFQDPGMNSFNHYAIGAVGEWVYRNVAGINPDPERPGYERFIIRPRPGGGLTFARGEYQSIRGRIVSAWRLDEEGFHLEVTVPANATALVHVPARDVAQISESGRPAAEAEGVRFLRLEGGTAVYQVGSGTYHFTAR